MNRFFKLLYVNLLALFDINKIKIARENRVKSNLERKTVIMGIVALFYGYLLYKLLMKANITNNIYILVIGFLLSSIFCLVIDLSLIEPIIFKGEDNDMLFSLPLTKYQIIFSKLFTIYLRNLLFVTIIMFSTILSFINYGQSVNDDFVLMYVISSLFIPFIPIVIATIISYINSYLKVKLINNKVYYYILKYIVIILIFIVLFMVFRGTNIDSIDQFVHLFIDKANIIYPMNFFFYIMVRDENVLFFVLLIVIPILVIYVYSFLLSNNYLKICSMLKGIKRKVSFKYKRTINLHKVLGMVRKEVTNLLANKYYLFSSYAMIGMLSVMLFICLRVVNLDVIKSIENFDIYLNLYCPTILAMFVTFNIMGISSMSLEKDNMQMLRTMPIGMGKIIFGKWLCNVLLSSIFIIINAFIVWGCLNKDLSLFIFNIIVPFFALMFASLTAIMLDYRFICKGEINDNVIIKQRLITLLPSFISLVIGISPFFLPAYVKYKFVLGSYILLFIILMIIEIVYMFINRKKLVKGLFN